MESYYQRYCGFVCKMGFLFLIPLSVQASSFSSSSNPPSYYASTPTTYSPQDNSDKKNQNESLNYTRSSALPTGNSQSSKGPLSPFSPGSSNLELDVGEIFLTGSLAKYFQDSIGTELKYTYGVSDLFAFESSTGYSGFSKTNDTMSLMYLNAGLRTNLVFFDQLIPYASFDLGFYRPAMTIDSVNYAALLFGLSLGAGVDLTITKNLFFGTRLTYHDMFGTNTTGSNGDVLSVGGSFISFLIHAGMSF